MSQVVSPVEHQVEHQPEREIRPPEAVASEFEYHPVPPLAPISLFLGVCALAGLAAVPGLAVGLVGAIVGLIALRQISRSEGELSGRVVARLGVGLSLVFLVAGAGLHAYSYATEVPEGYSRVSFNWLSKQALSTEGEEMSLSPEVESLEGKPIFIKGYMYPTRQRTGISEFVLVKDTGQCCFGGQPALTDVIIVRFRDGKTVDHREQTLVSVAGTFHARKPGRSGEVDAVYTLDGTHFK